MEAVANVQALYENAVLMETHGDKKHGEKNIVIRRFAAPFVLGENIADAFLTLKETTDQKNGARVYSLELTEIKMPSEKAMANDKSPAHYTDGILKLQRKHEKINAFLKKNEKNLFSVGHGDKTIVDHAKNKASIDRLAKKFPKISAHY